MKIADFFFYLGGVVNTIFLYGMATEMIFIKSYPATEPRTIDWGVATFALATFVFAGIAFWLKSRDKMLLANLLLWIPAIPGLLFAGFASLFIIHDIFYK
jgi:hypothetical protein